MKSFQELHIERRERLLIKAMLGWIKYRFAMPLQMLVPQEGREILKTVASLEQLQKAAIISDEDAWLLEQNAGLFGIVAKTYMRKLLPNEVFANHGAPTLMSDRKNRVVDIALLPPTSTTPVLNVMPCSMYIADKRDVVKKFRDVSNFTKGKHVDIVAMLIRNIDVLLSKNEQDLIHECFDKYKADDDVLALRESIVSEKEKEEKNLQAIQKVIRGQGDKTSLAKLAITLFTIVEHSYKTNPQNVMRIRYGTGGATPVFDYSRLFVIDYPVDLNMIQNILGTLMSGDIKIHVHDNKILFTTTNNKADDDDAMANVVTSMIESEEDLEVYFSTFVGPVATVSEVKRVMQRFLQEKYSGYEHTTSTMPYK